VVSEFFEQKENQSDMLNLITNQWYYRITTISTNF